MVLRSSIGCCSLLVVLWCSLLQGGRAWVPLPSSGKLGISQHSFHNTNSFPVKQKWSKTKPPTPRPLDTQETAKKVAKAERLLRVVTDIDDTVKSSGNKRLVGIPLGGIDAQYARGEFYPGVFQFALELAAHGTPKGQPPLPVAVLTARAKEFLFALELKSEHPVSIGYR